MLCGAPWLDTELTCQLDAGHPSDCYSKYRMEFPDGTASWGEMSWTGPRNHVRCQYCGQPSTGYTCAECSSGWPEHCTCENNGDYCPACLAWVEERAKLKEGVPSHRTKS